MNNSKIVTPSIQTSSKISVRMMTLIGILSAISTIIMLFEIPLWFAPGFYKLDLSEIVVAIGAFTLGPVAGIIIELLKNLLNLLLNGTVTAGVGEFANFIFGCAFIVPSAIIYSKIGKFKGASIGLIVGTVSLVIISCVVNYYVLLPVYAKALNAPLDAFIGMGAAINSKIVDLKTLVLLATAPFNLVKGVVVSAVVLLTYKKLTPILHK